MTTEEKKTPPSMWRLVRRIFGYARRYYVVMIVMIFVMTLLAVVDRGRAALIKPLFDNIDSTLPKVRCVEEVYATEQRPLRTLRNYLTRVGLTEIVNWTFLELEDLRRAGLDSQIDDAIALENPLSEKQAYMRTSLIPALLHTTSDNLRKNQNNVRLFDDS